MKPSDGNTVTALDKDELRKFMPLWSPNRYIDLHQRGVDYFNPEYLPVKVDAQTYNSLVRRGLTPPMALPVYFKKDSVHTKLNAWLDFNYYKLFNGGVQYLGNEANIQPARAWDKAELKVCFVRLSAYEVVDGSFGHHLVANWITDFTDNIFIDFSYMPAQLDVPKFLGAGFPLMFGYTTKRPLSDFDVVIFAQSYPQERINLPLALVKSGIPLYKWERWDASLPYYEECPLVLSAGLGSSFTENVCGDNPVHGVGANSLVDWVLIGEGEMAALKFLQEYLYCRKAGESKLTFRDKITNIRHKGLYDPSRVLFEYGDKEYIERDRQGNVLDVRTYTGAGDIKRISLIDDTTETLHVIAGEESEEFQDMEGVNQEYLTRYVAPLKQKLLEGKDVCSASTEIGANYSLE
jgi:hypothetical protein